MLNGVSAAEAMAVDGPPAAHANGVNGSSLVQGGLQSSGNADMDRVYYPEMYPRYWQGVQPAGEGGSGFTSRIAGSPLRARVCCACMSSSPSRLVEVLTGHVCACVGMSRTAVCFESLTADRESHQCSACLV